MTPKWKKEYGKKKVEKDQKCNDKAKQQLERDIKKLEQGKK